MLRSLIKKLDNLWADVVKSNAGYRCEYCGIRGRMEAAHVVGRRHRATRWGIWLNTTFDSNGKMQQEYDLAGHCLCHRCHQQYDEHGPLEDKIIDKVIGCERKSLLQWHARGSVVKDQEYEVIKETLESMYDVSDVPESVRKVDDSA